MRRGRSLPPGAALALAPDRAGRVACLGLERGGSDLREIDKAFAYVTHGERLLVFRHVDAPEAGIQVPAGTIEPGEAPAAAALREAQEETGLRGLSHAHALGVSAFDMTPFGRPEIQRRYFFHLEARGEPPERWRHRERHPAHGGPHPIFEFFWTPFPGGVPHLIAGHGALLEELERRRARRRG